MFDLEIVMFGKRAGIRGYRYGDMTVPGRAVWLKYGLSISNSVYVTLTKPELERAIHSHDLVSTYLEAHPEVAAKYEVGQTGEIKYFDVLTLAEKGEKCLEQSGRDQT